MNWWDRNLNRMADTFYSWLGDEHADSRLVAVYLLLHNNINSVLDCGCAHKLFEKTLKSTNIKYTGMDFAEYYQDKFQPITKGDIQDIPFKANSFDCVYTRHVLEHLPRFETALDEMVRVASKLVVVTFFNKPGEQERIIIEDDVHTNWYRTDDIVNHLKKNKKVKEIDWVSETNTEITLVVKLK